MLKKAAELTEKYKVVDVFAMLTEEDSFNAPKSTHQIYDKMNRNKKNDKPKTSG